MSDGASCEPVEPGDLNVKPKRGWSLWRRLVDLAVVAAFIGLILYVHQRVVRVVYVGTGSMIPTVQPGDRLLVHLAAYRKAKPQRGDIIAFWAEEQKEYEVKRVIAIGGDMIIVGGGAVILNDRRLREPYVTQPMIREPPVGGLIPEGYLFVMGDNRNGSEDSRDYGPIREDQVIGKIVFRLLPLGRAGRVR